MNKTSTLIAALTLAASGAAFAQGTPPTTAPANPATAAGTQNPVGGPMGTTGTTPQSNSGMSGAAPAPSSSGSMSSGTATDTTAMASPRPMRPARADRN